MTILTDDFYSLIATPPTRQYIETGTYVGDGIQRVLGRYERIHSIELSRKYAFETAAKFLHCPEVTVYHGNSKEVLPVLLATIQEPVTIFLDGHYSGGETAMGDEIIDGFSSAPLLAEIEIIMSRPWDDIVVIDDTRMFGRRDRLNAGVKSHKWPEYDYDWTQITDNSVRSRLKTGYEIFKNQIQISEDTFQNLGYSLGPNLDQWILARPR